ncbi:MAG TPA: hypothetical protein VFB21_25465 [Chthonomonadaceae bacterium]|nr:hypothetical protein [Chthonomonadaceae bacterium]
MPNPFDETLQHLVESQPHAWIECVGWTGETVKAIDADLSTLTAEADKALKIVAPTPALAPMESRSGYDATLGDRTLLYNVLLRHRHVLPVRSVLLLLRKKADSAQMTGAVRHTDPEDGERLHDFRHRVVRVWERPTEAILSGRLATLPLALLSQVTRAQLPGVIQQMQARIRQKASPSEARELWSATYILMGLNYPDAFTAQLLEGVQGMEDSVTYPTIRLPA